MLFKSNKTQKFIFKFGYFIRIFLKYPNTDIIFRNEETVISVFPKGGKTLLCLHGTSTDNPWGNIGIPSKGIILFICANSAIQAEDGGTLV